MFAALFFTSLVIGLVEGAGIDRHPETEGADGKLNRVFRFSWATTATLLTATWWLLGWPIHYALLNVAQIYGIAAAATWGSAGQLTVFELPQGWKLHLAALVMAVLALAAAVVETIIVS